MCGGHGLHHLLGLMDTEIAQSATQRPQTGGGSFDMENEVKLLYARGEIGPEAFKRLHSLAQSHELSVSDLHPFQRRASQDPRVQATSTKAVDESALIFSRQRQTQRESLEAARAETEASLRRLQLEVATIYHEAELADLDPEQRTLALSRAESAERRMEVIRERLEQLTTRLTDVASQQQLLEG